MSADTRRSSAAKAEAFLPLRPVWFHILITLADQPAHGYAIRQAVEARTGGRIRLWPTTLYGTLGQLQESGLIDEVPADGADEAVPRRTYRLSTLGRHVLAAEANRLEHLLDLARAAMGRRRLT
jgi:DNA-binding PadR family transcriptional regulator